MPTSKIVVKTPEEFMSGYTPVYTAIMGNFLAKGVAHAVEAEKKTFRRIEAVGDLRSKHITPKDTEMKLTSLGSSSRVYKKYYLGSKIEVSDLQSQEGVNDGIAQVLDEHWVQADELFLYGEGTSHSTMINNGLFYSADPNYVAESAATVKETTGTLEDMHAKILSTFQESERLAGEKIVVLYGDKTLTRYDSVYSSSNAPFKRILREVLAESSNNVRFARIPKGVEPSTTNGIIIANLDQCRMHYSKLPSMEDNGHNAEGKYSWYHFLLGSTMLEVLSKGAVIHQPFTFSDGE